MKREEEVGKPPAMALADRLARALKQGAQAPGTVIASLAELQARYRVGRPVLRQAVKILEERGIAALRRGKGGGLVALGANPDYPGRALSILIEREITDFTDLAVLPRAMDYYVYVFEAPYLGWDACRQLREMVEDFDRLPDEEFLRCRAHHQVAQAIRLLTRDPVLELMEKASYECAVDLIPYGVSVRNDSKESIAWQITRETVDALIAGDVAWLMSCMDRMMAVLLESWQSGEPSAKSGFSALTFQSARNQTDRVTREILREVRALEWQAGQRIATGADLARRFQTTPDIVRQAIVVLQQYGVIEVEKGRSGGLFVAELNRPLLLESARGYLREQCFEPRILKEILLQLTLGIVVDLGGRSPERLRHNAATAQLQGRRLPALMNEICNHPVLSVLTELASPLLEDMGEGSHGREIADAIARSDLVKASRLLIETYRSWQGAGGSRTTKKGADNL